jgi:4-amino-4-deoxy-L-arabinose transferase-like glycosyltransferase
VSQRIFILLLILITLLRAWIANQVNLGVDEAHYYWYGKFIDWSYFDHPPLVGWVHSVFQIFLPKSELAARLPAILISFLTSLLAYQFMRDRGSNDSHARLAILALNSTLLFNLQSLMLLPDTLLMPITFLVIKATEESVKYNQISKWLKLGLYLGLAALAKYTSIFFVVAIMVYFLKKNRWYILAKGQFVFGLIAALFLLLPLGYWNFKNDFVSFKYQSEHIFSFEKLSLKYVIQTQVAQLLLWGGGLYLISLVRMFSFRSDSINSKHEFTFTLARVLFLVFFIISFSQFVLPHWLLVVFVLILPLAVLTQLQASREKFVQVLTVISFLMTLSLFLEFRIHFLPPTLRPSIYKQLVGWPEIMSEANQLLDKMDSPKKAIAVTNWTLGSRSLYYNNSTSNIFILDHKFNQFDIWNTENPKNYELILMIESDKIVETLASLQCRNLEFIKDLNVYVQDTVVNQMKYYKCAGFGGLQ